MRYKKGQQEGLNVAVLVALIALFIIGYIVLLPPSEREKLLNQDDNNNNNGNNVASTSGDVLISETPGVVRSVADEGIKHKLSPIDLFVRDEPETSDVVPNLFVSRDVFSNKMQSINFVLEDSESLEEVVMFFSVRNPRGRLIVTLNGQEVFNNNIDEGTVASIELPVNLLRSRNSVTFSTSFTIFGSNHYTLDDIKLRKQFNIRNVEGSRTFVIDKDEFDRMSRARLQYFVSCISPQKETTDLQIEINSRPFERLSVPCVGDEVTFDIDKDMLNEGRNTIKFSINTGDFRFTDLQVQVDLNERVFPTYNFVIDDDQFDDLQDNRVDAVLKMNFANDKTRKQAQIFINGNRLFLDTTGDVYTKDVSSFLEDGSNELKIVPTSEFEILNLDLRLE